MQRYVWLLCFSLELCWAQNDPGCCGDIDVDGICSKCCQNYHLLEGICKECPLGFYGYKCNTECIYPWYGALCGLSCTDYPNNCSKADCHPALGCQNNGRIIVTQTTQSSSKKQLNSNVSTPATPIYVGTTVAGTNLNTTDAPWLVSVVKILGCTLGVSLLVNMGLVCLFIFKRRRESTPGKSMNNLQQSEQELKLYNASCQQNVGRVVDTSRNNINSSAPYHDLSADPRLRRSDDKGRKESVGKSTHTYLEPIPRECIDIDNPSYVDMTLLDSVRS